AGDARMDSRPEPRMEPRADRLEHRPEPRPDAQPGVTPLHKVPPRPEPKVPSDLEIPTFIRRQMD
ncbi:MAG TPA: hypothetical protein VF665_14590, partial [Longimicrobium sp.]